MRSARLPLVRKHELTDYRKNQARSILFLLLLTLLLLVSVLLSLRAGSYNTPVTELIKGIFGRSADKKINLVIRNNRMPRICTAIVAGAGLGLSGCILQAILHNPLASASTLGVSQGATFGAAFAIVTLNLTGGIGISLWSFLGSIAVAVVILGLSRLKQVSAEGIVLAGVAISSMLGGATTLIQYFANEIQLASLVFWTFGDLGSTGWSDLRVMSGMVLVLLAYCVSHRWDYNALLSGEETAVSLGIHVQRLTLTNMVLCCLTCSIIVSRVGLINFIGLVAPHIVRMVVGNNHVYLIPGSVLAGDGSGSIALARGVPGFDSFLLMALVLESMAFSGESSSQIAARLPRYYIIKRAVPCSSSHAYSILRSLRGRLFPDAEFSEEDGLRFDWEDGWVHLRASMTEPIVRMIVEWKGREKAEEYAAKVYSIIERVVAS